MSVVSGEQPGDEFVAVCHQLHDGVQLFALVGKDLVQEPRLSHRARIAV